MEWTRPRAVAAVVLVLIFIVLSVSTSAIGIPRYDEAYVLYGLERIGHGDVPIEDFQAYDVGRYYLLRPAFVLAGATGTFLFGSILLLVSAAALSTAALRGVGRPDLRPWLRIALTTLLVVWGTFPRYKMVEAATVHVLILAVIIFVRRGTTGSALGLGITVGLAALIGRNFGVYGFVAAVLAVAVSRRRARVRDAPLGAVAVPLLIGVAVGWLPMLLLLAVRPGFRVAYLEVLARNVRAGTNVSLPVPWPWAGAGDVTHPVSWLFVVIPIVLAVAAVGAWRRGRRVGLDPVSTALAAGALCGVPLLHYTFSRADYDHAVRSAAPVIVVAVVLLATALASDDFRTRRLRATACVAGIAVLSLPAALTLVRPLAQGPWRAVTVEYGPTEQRLATQDEYRWLLDVAAIEAAIHADSSVAALPREVGYYLETGREAPVRSIYLGGRATAAHDRSVAEELGRVDYVVLRPGPWGENPRTDLRVSYPESFAMLQRRCRVRVDVPVLHAPYEVRLCQG